MNLFDYYTTPEELTGYDERGLHYIVPSLAFQYLRRHLKHDDVVRIEKYKKALEPIISKDKNLLRQYNDLLAKYNKLNEATLEDLPQGKIFSDAKDISGIFKLSKRPHNELLVEYEKGEKNAKVVDVDMTNIQITQPNVIAGKVSRFLKMDTTPPPIHGVAVGKNVVIVDGHHRLVSAYLKGAKSIKVKLVK